MFAVLWDNFGDVNGRFFPYFAQLETISIFRCSKKDKGVREKRRNENPDFTIPLVCLDGHLDGLYLRNHDFSGETKNWLEL